MKEAGAAHGKVARATFFFFSPPFSLFPTFFFLPLPSFLSVDKVPLLFFPTLFHDSLRSGWLELVPPPTAHLSFFFLPLLFFFGHFLFVLGGGGEGRRLAFLVFPFSSRLLLFVCIPLSSEDLVFFFLFFSFSFSVSLFFFPLGIPQSFSWIQVIIFPLRFRKQARAR